MLSMCTISLPGHFRFYKPDLKIIVIFDKMIRVQSITGNYIISGDCQSILSELTNYQQVKYTFLLTRIISGFYLIYQPNSNFLKTN